MEILLETVEDVAILRLPALPLDSGTANRFSESSEALRRGKIKVVLDLGQVSFIDSAGLGAIVALARKLSQEQGDLKVCGLNKSVRALFQMVRMHKVVEVFETAEEATRAFALA